MEFHLEYSVKATSDLADLTNVVRKQIIKKLETYLQSEDPMIFAKALSGKLKGLYRFRAGDYRIVFQKEPDGTIIIILILRIRHRREVYD